jgi:hypothetical protein
MSIAVRTSNTKKQISDFVKIISVKNLSLISRELSILLLFYASIEQLNMFTFSA